MLPKKRRGEAQRLRCHRQQEMAKEIEAERRNLAQKRAQAAASNQTTAAREAYVMRTRFCMPRSATIRQRYAAEKSTGGGQCKRAAAACMLCYVCFHASNARVHQLYACR